MLPHSPTYPALQRQAIDKVLLAGAKLSDGHSFVSLPPGHQYPSAHSVHWPPHVPTQPALHRQSVASSLSDSAFEFSGQDVRLPPEQN
eukprot:3266150-Rhodomonas_salina.2